MIGCNCCHGPRDSNGDCPICDRPNGDERIEAKGTPTGSAMRDSVPGISDGSEFVLVPKEPSEEMLEAVGQSYLDIIPDQAEAVWQIMLAAAPSPVSDDVKELVERGADWLVDAVAAATQDRRFLRDDAAEDKVATEALLLNGKKAIQNALARLSSAHQAAEERVKVLEKALEFYADPFAWKKANDPDDDMRVPDFYSELSFGDTARAALQPSPPSSDDTDEIFPELQKVIDETTAKIRACFDQSKKLPVVRVTGAYIGGDTRAVPSPPSSGEQK